jgi:hypothetical protein
LAGIPADGERGVPTNVVPVFASVSANLFAEEEIVRAGFELTSPSGEIVPLTPQVRFAYHFELVPKIALEPGTEYTLRATLPTEPTVEPSIAVSLSFTTGDQPFTGTPLPPDARMQHYHSNDPTRSSCDPLPDGSCIFFPPESGVELSYSFSPDTRYLVFGAWGTNLTGVNQGNPATCVTFRTRAADGTMSEPMEICRDDAETLTVPDLTGLGCTENGLAIDGVPIADEPDGDGSRTILTEGGCGCRVPAPARGSGTMSSLGVALSLLLARRRRT